MTRVEAIEEVILRLTGLMKLMYPTFRNFPRVEHNMMVNSIKLSVFDAITYLELAKCVKSKALEHLQTSQAHIHNLRVLLRMSRELKFISPQFFSNLDLQIQAILETLTIAFKNKA